MSIKKAAVITAASLSLLGTGAAVGSAAASTSTLQTVSKSEVLTGPRSYHLHQVTITYFRWNTKAGRYLPESPRRTVTDQNVTHP